MDDQGRGEEADWWSRNDVEISLKRKPSRELGRERGREEMDCARFMRKGKSSRANALL